jgi:hypothetical protein
MSNESLNITLDPITDQHIHDLQAGKIRTQRVKPSAENIQMLKTFLIEQWDIALLEMAEDTCGDLSNSCIPVVLFTNAVFGGSLDGTSKHIYNIVTVSSMVKGSVLHNHRAAPLVLDMTEHSKRTQGLGWIWDNDAQFLLSKELFTMFEEYLDIVNVWVDNYNTKFKK